MERRERRALTGEIKMAIDWVVESLAPYRVFIYNRRENHRGQVTGFKLCIIADTPDKAAAERDIYLGFDSDVPFDVLIYTPEEWEQITRQEASFAKKIIETGLIVYEKA